MRALLGIVTLTCAFVVGGTWMINTWADLLIKYWQYDQLSHLLAPYKGQPTVPVAERASVQESFEAACAALPGTRCPSRPILGPPSPARTTRPFS